MDLGELACLWCLSHQVVRALIHLMRPFCRIHDDVYNFPTLELIQTDWLSTVLCCFRRDGVCVIVCVLLCVCVVVCQRRDSTQRGSREQQVGCGPWAVGRGLWAVSAGTCDFVFHQVWDLAHCTAHCTAHHTTPHHTTRVCACARGCGVIVCAFALV